MGAGQNSGTRLEVSGPGGKKMRFLKYIALLAVLGVVLMPAAKSHAQVSVGVGVGAPAYPASPDPYYAAAPPVCPYGYYGYAPYGCAPYGYYGPNWFVGGLFIGAGPWYRPGYYYNHGGYYPFTAATATAVATMAMVQSATAADLRRRSPRLYRRYSRLCWRRSPRILRWRCTSRRWRRRLPRRRRWWLPRWWAPGGGGHR